MSKIGILGGTFDPVHLGHTELAASAAAELKLDKIYLMPANTQPFKIGRRTASSEDRLEMLKLAASDYPNMEVLDYELKKEGISYTYETISELRSIYHGDEFCFIVGSDSLLKIDSWYKGDELLRICSIAVGLRDNSIRSAIQEKAIYLSEKFGTDVTLIDKLIIPVSSTDIRERIENGLSVSGMISPEVEDYIYEKRLYL